MNEDQILDKVTTFFVESRDFNGIPCRAFYNENKQMNQTVIDQIYSLIDKGKLTVVYDINPHIKRYPDMPLDKQKQVLKEKAESCCLYPTREVMEKRAEIERYDRLPYAREMFLAEPQISWRAFDLSVLETYRNDPRYRYTNDDIRGDICVSSEHYEKEGMDESDKILLDTFGFSFSEEMDKYVAVFLRYLADLSAEHQQIWKAKETKVKTLLHPDYYRNTIEGDFGEKLSLSEAFLEELVTINRMCSAIGKPPLFREDFKDNKPRNFGFLVRPTKKEFFDFVDTIDKMMSQNLNQKFFEGYLSLEAETTREDGKIIVTPKGTVSLLEEWINKYFRAEDREPMERLIATFKKIRKLRQTPAHKVFDDHFDKKYYHDQRELFIAAYTAVRFIRLMLTNYGEAKNVKVNDHLYRGEIWNF